MPRLPVWSILSFGEHVVCKLYARYLEHFHQPDLEWLVFTLPSWSILPPGVDIVSELQCGDLEQFHQRHIGRLVSDLSIRKLLSFGIPFAFELQCRNVQHSLRSIRAGFMFWLPDWSVLPGRQYLVFEL